RSKRDWSSDVCSSDLEEHGVRFQKAKSKYTMGIVERYNRTLTERLFHSQDASDLLTLHLNKISQAWVRNLPIVVEYINNSITRRSEERRVGKVCKYR